MADEETEKENAVKSTAEAVKAVIETDLVKSLANPAAKELGQGLETVAKAINKVLIPVRLLVWGLDVAEAKLKDAVTEKAKDIPSDRVQEPPLHLAAPAIEGFLFSQNEPNLRDMYVSLIATSMDTRKAVHAHPAFVNIIRQLSSDEAKILPYFLKRTNFALIDVRVSKPKESGYTVAISNCSDLGIVAGCQHPDYIPEYIDNLERLGLIRINSIQKLESDESYDSILAIPEIKSQMDAWTSSGLRVEAHRHYFNVTQFGTMFCQACISDGSIIVTAEAHAQ